MRLLTADEGGLAPAFESARRRCWPAAVEAIETGWLRAGRQKSALDSRLWLLHSFILTAVYHINGEPSSTARA